MGTLRGTIPCSSKRKIGGQLWCLIWLKEVQFSRQKTGSCRFVKSGRYPSEKKSSNRRVERVVSRQIEEKKMKKRSILRS